MSLIEPETGILHFSDEDKLDPFMLTPSTRGIESLGMRQVEGGGLKLLYYAVKGGGRQLWLLPFPDLLRPVTAEQRFEFLIATLGLQLPPETGKTSFQIQFPFGSVYVAADPLTGTSEAMLCYPPVIAVKGEEFDER